VLPAAPVLALSLAGCTPAGTSDGKPPSQEIDVPDSDTRDDTQETGDASQPSSLHSLLRVESHAHPYDRDDHGEFYHDGGAALTSSAAVNALPVVLASVRLEEGEDANGQAALDLAKSNPRVIPLLWVTPSAGEGASRAEVWLQDHPFAGLKFHPQHDDLPADSELMDPYLELAARYGVPVVIHTAGDDPSLASRVGALAARHPQVQVVLYHTGLGTDHDEAIEVVRSCANCWAETSWMDLASSLDAIERLGAERVLFGTDMTIDGPDHYENDWGSGGAGGSWDGWLADLGRQLDRDAYRRVMVLNAVELFHLVTIHSHQPEAAEVTVELDLGHGTLADRLPMLDEGNGWWGRSVPAPRGLAFRVVADGVEPTGKPLVAKEAEVWEREGVLTDAPAETTLRFRVDVGYGHAVYVRGSGYPLSWNRGEPATWEEDEVWTLRLAGVTGTLEVKALADDTTWEQGDNHQVEPGGTLEASPLF